MKKAQLHKHNHQALAVLNRACLKTILHLALRTTVDLETSLTIQRLQSLEIQTARLYQHLKVISDLQISAPRQKTSDPTHLNTK